MGHNGCTVRDVMNEWLTERVFLVVLIAHFCNYFWFHSPSLFPSGQSYLRSKGAAYSHVSFVKLNRHWTKLCTGNSLCSTIHLFYPQPTHCLVRDRQTQTNNGNTTDKWLNNTEGLLSINTFKVGANFIKWLHFQRMKIVLYWLSKLYFILLS